MSTSSTKSYEKLKLSTRGRGNKGQKALNFCFRVMAPPKSSSNAQIFVASKEGTIWNKIYKNHMTEESFILSTQTLHESLETNEKITYFTSVDVMTHISPHKCSLKILWKSPKHYSG